MISNIYTAEPEGTAAARAEYITFYVRNDWENEQKAEWVLIASDVFLVYNISMIIIENGTIFNTENEYIYPSCYKRKVNVLSSLMFIFIHQNEY